MAMINYYFILLIIFAMVALGEIFKLKKEVRKLNNITNYLLNTVEKQKSK